MVERFWASIGMNVTIMAVEEHDRTYALGKCSRNIDSVSTVVITFEI